MAPCQWFVIFLKFSRKLSIIPNYFPLQTGVVLIFTTLNPLRQRLFCAKFGWNRPSGSGKIYSQTDGRTTTHEANRVSLNLFGHFSFKADLFKIQHYFKLIFHLQNHRRWNTLRKKYNPSLILSNKIWLAPNHSQMLLYVFSLPGMAGVLSK